MARINLRYHGLIQAYSRTNRILDATKTFGNIVTFRDLEKATEEAITLFGKANTKHSIVLEKSYKEYMEGYVDDVTGKEHRGYLEIVAELQERFPNPNAIDTEADKKYFAKLFGEYLRVENVLQNYDEYATLKALQSLDTSDSTAVEAFKEKHYVLDEDIDQMQAISVFKDRAIQNYNSVYGDIREWIRKENEGNAKNEMKEDWGDVVFEVELLKSQEINLDYISGLIFENNKKNQNKSQLVEEVRSLIRSSIGNRAKESLMVEFIHQTDLDAIPNKESMLEKLFQYAQIELKREANELIDEENLDKDAAKRYISSSLKREYAINNIELNDTLPKMSPLNPQYLIKKQNVLQKVSDFVEKFKGIGSDL